MDGNWQSQGGDASDPTLSPHPALPAAAARLFDPLALLVRKKL
jgi:hypothetical protein